MVRLLRLGASTLVDRGAAAIRRYYEGRVGHAHPYTCQPDWSAADFARRGEPAAEVCSRAVLGVVHADLLQDCEAVVDLWRRGDWQALHVRGEIGAEELRQFTAGYQGNPNYPGWAGRPGGLEPDF